MNISGKISEKIALELNIRIQQVDATIGLLDDGATVPFISRYRKEITGSLTDTQLRQLEERLRYLRELEDRRQTILKSITEQQKLTPELEQQIADTDSKAVLEDLYAPYKPKRRTKAQIAREAGLEPLALGLLNNPKLDPNVFAEQFINADKQVAADALEGARHILIEMAGDNASLIGYCRDYLWTHGILKCAVTKGKETDGNKFSDYFDYNEAIKNIPSHRALAFLRGQREECLNLNLTLTDDQQDHCVQTVCKELGIHLNGQAADAWLAETASWAWRIRIALKLELELLTTLRENAEEEAIRVFANNLKHLLMASPAGSHITLGLDPGLRSGVKGVVVDGTGKLLHYFTFFPHAPRNDWDNSITLLAAVCAKYNVELISIGNGTASRETDKLVSELKRNHPTLTFNSIVVSEAGASVYSASEYAAQEFPDLDVTYRGAVSIARRLQDPLAELVKIEPKAIGVGQYQHDVNQFKLSRTLRTVMEDCVNAVGVDINTASAPLLTCVAGLNETLAKNIVAFRDTNGRFANRMQLKKVPRLGEKAFEQSAGFLRIVNGDNPLDMSAVHPEAYSVVEKILTTQNKSIHDVMGNTALLRTVKAKEYINDKVGLLTVQDILLELEKPGRDPRPEFKTATFKEGVETLKDLTPGMVLEGVVTNVANFGAFVDIGVHQDGLVHISMLADHFVKDPNTVVKVGDIVKVKVLEVDVARHRIKLTMRLTEPAVKAQTPIVSPNVGNNKNKRSAPTSEPAFINSAFRDAFMKAKKKK